MIIVYSSVLDLSTCEKTIKQAQKNFIECLNIYLKETVKHGTLEKNLLNHECKSNPENLSILPPEEIHKNIHILKRTEIRVPITV